MIFLYIFTVIAIIVSFIINWKKTLKGLKIAFFKFIKILPAFLIMIILISLILFFIPDKTISELLSRHNKYLSSIIASLIGSITLMPGFIAYPMCSILKEKGVSHMVIAAFVTTLMMVGIATFPIEREYFGTKLTIIRNVLCFIISLITALVIGLFFGELF